MRFESITAEAFGPFQRKTLELAEGMTVIHGPNEAGKSTWFAALQAGLCGRRGGRGRGTAIEAAFRRRHKPWRGSRWAVSATIRLDSRQRLVLVTDLANGPNTAIKDAESGRSASVAEWERRLETTLTTEGTFDGARLLGLDRTLLRNTVFVAQADVLAVLHEAGSLQEFLQRAAASSSADTTAEEALEWLNSARKERVGSPSIGSRPLRRAIAVADQEHQAMIAARDQLGAARELASEVRQARERHHQHAGALREAQARVTWQALDELGERVATVERLTASLATTPTPAPGDEALLSRVAGAVAALTDRGPRPLEPTGQTATEIKERLDALPSPPQGDADVAPEVAAAAGRLERTMAALEQQLATIPEGVPDPGVSLSSDELRSLADVLDPPIPDVDEHVIAEAKRLEEEHSDRLAEHEAAIGTWEAARAAYEAAQATYATAMENHEQQRREYAAGLRDYEEAVRQRDAVEQRNRSAQEAFAGAVTLARTAELSRQRRRKSGMVLAGIGLLVVVLGGVLGALLAPALSAICLVGLAPIAVALPRLSVGGSDVTPTAPTLETVPPLPQSPQLPGAPSLPAISAPGTAPLAPAPDPQIAELRATIRSQEIARDSARERRMDAETRAKSLSLPIEPDALRRLAGQVDDSKHSAVLKSQHEARVSALETEVRAALDEVFESLRSRQHAHTSPHSEQPLAEAVPTARTLIQEYTDRCRENAITAHEAARRPGLEQALNARIESEHAYQEALAAWTTPESNAMDLTVELGLAASTESVSAALKDWLEQQQSARQVVLLNSENRGKLDQLLDGRSLDELREELRRRTKDAPPRPAGQSAQGPAAELEHAQQVDLQLARAVAGLEGQLRTLAADLPDVPAAVERAANAEAELKELRDLDRHLELALSHVESAKRTANASIAPSIERLMQPWLAHVTLGRYSELSIDPSTLVITVRGSHGSPVEASLLSQGTAEQIYLLLRLALATHVGGGVETAPLILDDVTVQSDQSRTEAVLDLLHRVSEERQVVLFTQEPEVVGWAAKALVGERDAVLELHPPA